LTEGSDRSKKNVASRPRRGQLFLTPAAVRKWLLEATEELVPRRGAKLLLVAAEQLRRYGSVFAGYRAARHWYFSVEVWFAIATGLVTGLMLRTMGGTDPCAGAGWAWGVVAVGAVETAAALLLRAFALRLELVVFVCVMLLTMAAEIVALVDPNAVVASNGLSIAAAVLQLVAMLYGALEHFRWRSSIAAGGAPFVDVPSVIVAEKLIRYSRHDVDVALRVVINIICDTR
jgi:hypothetical protein